MPGRFKFIWTGVVALSFASCYLTKTWFVIIIIIIPCDCFVSYLSVTDPIKLTQKREEPKKVKKLKKTAWCCLKLLVIVFVVELFVWACPVLAFRKDKGILFPGLALIHLKNSD